MGAIPEGGIPIVPIFRIWIPLTKIYDVISYHLNNCALKNLHRKREVFHILIALFLIKIILNFIDIPMFNYKIK